VSGPVLSRRRFLSAGAAASSLLLAGCDRFDFLSSDRGRMRQLLVSTNDLTRRVQRLLVGDALAREYAETEIRQGQRPNGSVDPQTPEYLALRDNGFADYRLDVVGLVGRPLSLSLDELRNMPARSQITRHDCVEGWSCIAGWTGVPLALLLDQASVLPEARFVVFHCYDRLGGGLSGPVPYYESCDLIDARHPQTILAYGLNGSALPVRNGAPLRVRIERQLGYKMAKYLRTIELVESFAGFGGGRGGYWEDAAGYDWYAGI
jgi:DMSO/TMAO reductase YedYZ molybdopterin-dependent catalytic subunit